MKRNCPILVPLTILVLLLTVSASHTPDPTAVTIAGSLQSEVGCPGDWQPDCAATHLSFDASDGVWQGTFDVPAGNWEYKAPLNNSWDENYGANATRDGANIPLTLASQTSVKFYYDHKSHWITSNKNSVIAVAPGSFQSELGCPGDWQPDCLRSWLQDPDGDGTYTASFTLPTGSYETKVAINEAWDENYGQGGTPGGANIAFTVPPAGTANFAYNASTHVLIITIVTAEPSADNNVEWDGLRHDSRDALYRSPGGAVPADKEVKLRFRTFHNDVTAVTLRLYDVDAGAQQLRPMTKATEDAPCYQESLSGKSCDYWEIALSPNAPKNYWYRFIVTDGSDTDYYADNTPALDGGPGAVTEEVVDNSYSLMFYNPSFTTPSWAQNAVIYQIFPDRFHNGRLNNDARTGDLRYDDPVLALNWNTLPEGYCRNYADGDTNCPWRFDSTPPLSSPTKEQPRGRDYFGGDLKGVDQKLEYLQSLGVNTIYFNPIFDAGSNHSYDTQDYLRIDPYFGTQKDWENLVKHADRLGMRIILDNVFNHMSSDSAFFDRYRHFSTTGACESADSQFRSWFNFRPPVGSEPHACQPSAAGNDTFYDGWFGFDSIPVLKKSNPAVQQFFVTSGNSVARQWLRQGASGWRLDVMGDPSFPAGYWEGFRQVVKQTKPSALIIGELWQKDSTLLRNLRGDRADATMNYRLRDAVIGFLTPGSFDSKGFADSGRQIAPSEFVSRLEAIGEDYPRNVYYSLMNLLDSHDTERVLWTLTPGAETKAEKEVNAANLNEGKLRLRLASLLQFFMPGAPTVYYGDEVGVTGDDDPDDRRTYPWADLGGTPDVELFQHYQALATIRKGTPALTAGDFRALLADDQAETVALGRKTKSQAAIVAVNRSGQARTISVPVGGYLPDGLELTPVYGVKNPASTPIVVTDGALQLSLAEKSGLLLTTAEVDLDPPEAPGNLHVTSEASEQVSLAWNSASDAASYNVYRSLLSGGGYVKANASPVSGTTFTDTALTNAKTYFYVVTALDATGNESAYSNEVTAVPHLQIGWANLQWPPSMTHTISTDNRTENAYGQVWIDGVTNRPDQTPGLRAQLGFGPDGSNPDGNAAWSWIEATFNVDAGNNDEFKASLLPMAVGKFDYAYRYTTTNGRDWIYADLDGIGNGYSPAQAGDLVVSSSGDTTPPATPTGLSVAGSSPSGISLQWNAVTGDATLHGYEVMRGTASGGPYQQVASNSTNEFTDISVVSNTTYFYVVRAVDKSFNRSGNSNQVSATAEERTVTLTFTVTVPTTTDATGRSVYIAGFLDRLDGNLPQWNPGGVVLTRVDATHWRISLTGKEGTQLEYKYTLGDWEHVEKDGACGEINNRMLTLSYGATGTQNVNDAVPNWRNVAPCGN